MWLWVLFFLWISEKGPKKFKSAIKMSAQMQEIETKTTNCQVRELHRKLRIIKHIAEKEAFIRQMAAASEFVTYAKEDGT